MDNQEPSTNSVPNQPPEIKKSHRGLVVYVVVVILLIVGISILAVHAHDEDKKKVENIVSNSSIAPAEISITKTGFAPQAVTIKVGQSVTWTNNDVSEHEVASDPYPMDNALPGLNSKEPILPAHTYSYVFSKAGTYLYHDNLNPYTIKGTIIVK